MRYIHGLFLGLLWPSVAVAMQDEDVAPRFLKGLGALESRYVVLSGSGKFTKAIYHDGKVNSRLTGEFEFARRRSIYRNTLSKVEGVSTRGQASHKPGTATLLDHELSYYLQRSRDDVPYVLLDTLPPLQYESFASQRELSYCDQSPYSLEFRKLSELIASENYEFVHHEPIRLDGKAMLRFEFGPSDKLFATADTRRPTVELFKFFVVVSPDEGWVVHRVTAFFHNLGDGQLSRVVVAKVAYGSPIEGTPTLRRYLKTTYDARVQADKIPLDDGQAFCGIFSQEETWQFDKVRFEPEPDSAFTLESFGLSKPRALK